MKLSKRIFILADSLDELTGKSLWQRQVKEEILAVAYMGPISVYVKAIVGILHSDKNKFVWKITWSVYGIPSEKDYNVYSETTYTSQEEAMKAAKVKYEEEVKPEIRMKS